MTDIVDVNIGGGVPCGNWCGSETDMGVGSGGVWSLETTQTDTGDVNIIGDSGPVA